MQESSGMIFSYLSPTWTRSPNCSRCPTSTRSPIWTEIAPRCDLSSHGQGRCLTSTKSVSRGRNPSRSRSRSPSWTRSP